MDISVGVIAAGSTSHREVAEIADDLREAVGGLKGVSSSDLIKTGAPGGGQILGAFLVDLPGGILPGIVEVLKSVAARGSQSPVIIESTTGPSKSPSIPNRLKQPIWLLCAKHYDPKQRPANFP